MTNNDQSGGVMDIREVLREVESCATNFHALVVGECGAGWMEDDHNAAKFLEALDQARTALASLPAEAQGDGAVAWRFKDGTHWYDCATHRIEPTDEQLAARYGGFEFAYPPAQERTEAKPQPAEPVTLVANRTHVAAFLGVLESARIFVEKETLAELDAAIALAEQILWAEPLARPDYESPIDAFVRLHMESMIREWCAGDRSSAGFVDGLVEVVKRRLARASTSHKPRCP